MSLKKEAILTPDAPQPIGPYSQAIRTGSLLFCSGQIALHPTSGEIVGKSVEEQTHQVMKNLEAVLRQAGANFSHVIKTNIYLKSMNDFPKVNEVYGSYLKGMVYPARACVEVARLPKDALVEIEMTAALQ